MVIITKILSFFTGGSLLGKIGGYLLIALISSGVLYGAYTIHINTVKAAALAEFNTAQLKQIVADQQTFINMMQQLQVVSEQTIAELRLTNAKTDALTSDITEYINSPEAQKSDRESSEILKQTIQRLQNGN